MGNAGRRTVSICALSLANSNCFSNWLRVVIVAKLARLQGRDGTSARRSATRSRPEFKFGQQSSESNKLAATRSQCQVAWLQIGVTYSCLPASLLACFLPLARPLRAAARLLKPCFRLLGQPKGSQCFERQATQIRSGGGGISAALLTDPIKSQMKWPAKGRPAGQPNAEQGDRLTALLLLPPFGSPPKLRRQASWAWPAAFCASLGRASGAAEIRAARPHAGERVIEWTSAG